jgi:hypothetical protein
MSRDWKEYNYISAEDFWMFIDEIHNTLELRIQSSLGKNSESYKLFLAGKSEMLEQITDFVHENQTSLVDIAEKRYLPLKEKTND